MVYMVLGKTLESPLDSKEMKPFNPKGNQPWIFIGRIDAEAEAPIFWPPDAKSHFSGKGTDAGKDWRQMEKTATEVEMVGWHHQFNGHELGQTLEDSEGLPRWLSGKESACQCRRLKRRRFDSWVRRSPGIVQSLTCVWLFVTPWTAACQAFLPITISQAHSNSCPSRQWCHLGI